MSILSSGKCRRREASAHCSPACHVHSISVPTSLKSKSDPIWFPAWSFSTSGLTGDEMLMLPLDSKLCLVFQFRWTSQWRWCALEWQAQWQKGDFTVTGAEDAVTKVCWCVSPARCQLISGICCWEDKFCAIFFFWRFFFKVKLFHVIDENTRSRLDYYTER